MQLRLGVRHDALVIDRAALKDLDWVSEHRDRLEVTRPLSRAATVGGVTLLHDVVHVIKHEGDGERPELAALEGQPFYPFRHTGVKLGALL